jgi:hypothetical protein
VTRLTTAREAAGGGHSRTKSPKTKNYAGDDYRTNERPDKYAEQWLCSRVASSGAKQSTDYSRDLQLCSIRGQQLKHSSRTHKHI